MKAIKAIYNGIDKFNDACRASVLKYTNEWQNYVHRQARWVDFEHGYKTLNIPYMESVMWAFKQLYDKGLAYQGYRVLPYCPKDRTPLSAHELRMDADVYQDRQDTTVSVAVKMRDEDDAYAVFWTTTPWTVPTNFAIVVGADIDYVEVRPTEGKFAGKKFYLGKDLLPHYEKERTQGLRAGRPPLLPGLPVLRGRDGRIRRPCARPERLHDLHCRLRRHRRRYRSGSPGPLR